MAYESIAAYHAAQAEADRHICDALRSRFDAQLPDATSKIWHGHPVWFLDENPIVGYSKLKSCVRLMFWSGQSFQATGLAPTGTFKAAEKRYTAASQIAEADLTAWLAVARMIQWDYKKIVKRKGRLERLS